MSEEVSFRLLIPTCCRLEIHLLFSIQFQFEAALASANPAQFHLRWPSGNTPQTQMEIRYHNCVYCTIIVGSHTKILYLWVKFDCLKFSARLFRLLHVFVSCFSSRDLALLKLCSHTFLFIIAVKYERYKPCGLMLETRFCAVDAVNPGRRRFAVYGWRDRLRDEVWEDQRFVVEKSLEISNFLAKLQLNFTLGLDKPACGSLFYCQTATT